MRPFAPFIASLLARDTCRYIEAKAGDGCYNLAQNCGISQDDLTKFNPSPFDCDKIKIGDTICCSAGALPDLSPQKKADGSCASYIVKSEDTCASIGAGHQLEDWQKIESFNKETWGWSGCSLIQAGQTICLSEGSPPFPAEMKNAVCGPQVSSSSTMTFVLESLRLRRGPEHQAAS